MKYLIALGPDKYDSENYLCRDGGASFCIWHLGKYSKFNPQLTLDERKEKP